MAFRVIECQTDDHIRQTSSVFITAPSNADWTRREHQTRLLLTAFGNQRRLPAERVVAQCLMDHDVCCKTRDHVDDLVTDLTQ